MGFFGIPNPYPRDRNFKVWARSKNLGNPGISGIGVGVRKHQKIPNAKSRKSPNPRGMDRDLKIPKKSQQWSLTDKCTKIIPKIGKNFLI